MRIAIVGAGPAGCHLAHRLGNSDHEILLFDPRAPYEKPCGGGLTSLVGRLFPDVMALPFARHCSPRLVLRASDGSQVEQDLGSAAWSFVSRADLGQALLDRALANANVRFITEKVTDLQPEGDRWRLRTAQGQAHLTDFLVGADGVRSIVRKRLIGPIPRRHLSLVVGYRVLGAPDAIVIQTYADLEGYLWSFPGPDHANIGIGGRLGTVPPDELWQRVDRCIYEMCPNARRVDRWAALVPTAHDSTLWDTPCAGTGWALLGDAAGHVYPPTGEGIAYALWSADLLAEAFLQHTPALYESLWRERYGKELASAAAMARIAGAQEGNFEMLTHLVMATVLPRIF